MRTTALLALTSVFLCCLNGGLHGLAQNTQKSIQLPQDHPTAQLKPGPNVEVVRNNCTICHSTDYVVRQPASDAKKWEAEVQKMIKVYGAPTSKADAKAIVEYLANEYGDTGTKGEKRKR